MDSRAAIGEECSVVHDGGADSEVGGLRSPFAALAAVRASPGLASDRTAIDQLADAANLWPPSNERTEARLLCAEAYAGRLHRPDLALALERTVASDPAAPMDARTLAARTLVDAEIDGGDLPAARADVVSYALFFDAKSLRKLHAANTRHMWTTGAETELVVALVLAVVPLLSRARSLPPSWIVWSNVRLSVLRALSFGAFVALAGGALAYGFDRSDPRPFVAVGGAVAAIASLGRIRRALAGPSSRLSRVVSAFVAAASVVAAAFLLVEWIDASYLAGFGL